MTPNEFITLNAENISAEHICCAFSDKKCAAGYARKKEWLAGQFGEGYVFRRLNDRAKVFIEYQPSEQSWIPVNADGYLMINCFWVAGQYKGHGYGKALLQSAIDDAAALGKNGLVTVAGTKKTPFMCDAKWLMGQGFKVVQTLSYGFSLLALKLRDGAPEPSFAPCAIEGRCDGGEGLTVYYTDRCPYTDFYVRESLSALAAKYGLPLNIIHLSTSKQAQCAPTPATIFSLFRDGRFLTSDMSVCTESRFTKILGL